MPRLQHILTASALFLRIVATVQPATAQQSPFSIPSAWTKPTVNLTLQEIGALTAPVVESLVPTFNPADGVIDTLTFTETGSLLYTIALLDYINGTTTYSNLVLGNLHTAWTAPQSSSPRVRAYNCVLNSDTVLWGIAAYYAWQAYNDTQSFDIAVEAWQRTSESVVQPSDAAKGTQATRNATFLTNCNGTTTAGAVFWLPGPASTDTGVNAETVGPFVALSMYLYKATADETYASAAQLTAEFLWNIFYNGTIIMDNLGLDSCILNPDVFQSYNQGWTMEALASLAATDSTWLSRLNALVPTSIPFGAWTALNGVNIEDQNTPSDVETQYNVKHASKVYLIRGLYHAWNQSDPNSDFAKYIEAYIHVQFNALTSEATIPGSNQYSSDWLGPPASELLPWGQLCALEVFRAELAIAQRTLPASTTASGPTKSSTAGEPAAPTSSSPLPSPPAHHKKFPGGAIAGIAIAIIAVVLCAAWFLWRPRKTGEEEYAREQMQFTSVPFEASDVPTAMYMSNAPAATSSFVLPSSYKPHDYFAQHEATPGATEEGLLSSSPFIPPFISGPASGSSTRPPPPVEKPTDPADIPGPWSSQSLAQPDERAPLASRMAEPQRRRSLEMEVSDNYGASAAPEATTSTVPGPAQAETSTAPADREADAANMVAVEGLLTELNRVLARLPPGGIEGQAPPEYRA